MDYFIAWWNLENLFDVEDSLERPTWLQKKLRSELKGWDESVLEQKLNQLASVIGAMNDGEGPDLLGVCEVENRTVLEKLVNQLNHPNRHYHLVHADTQDLRGIDVAFIYDAHKFHDPDPSLIFSHVVLKRNATRDILEVVFHTRTEPRKTLVVFANHWPSRTGGAVESEPYRMMAAETLSYWLERTYAKQGEKVAVIVMGDFNDEPYNRSITDYALGLKDSRRVKSKRSRKPYLFNLMWQDQQDAQGTHYYDSWGMLDQFMVNRTLLDKGSEFDLIPSSCQIHNWHGLVKKGKPRRFSRPAEGNAFDPEGYSDHLPVSIKIRSV